MNKDQAIQTIIDECENREGFLSRLRVENIFDAYKYQRLATAIGSYQQELKDARVIDRRVAGCLFYLVGTMESMVAHFENCDLPEKENLKNAYAEIWKLIDMLYAVP